MSFRLTLESERALASGAVEITYDVQTDAPQVLDKRIATDEQEHWSAAAASPGCGAAPVGSPGPGVCCGERHRMLRPRLPFGAH